MLNGKRYYGAFPDENLERPQILVSQELLCALAALEKEFRHQIEQFRRGEVLPDVSARDKETDGLANPVKP